MRGVGPAAATRLKAWRRAGPCCRSIRGTNLAVHRVLLPSQVLLDPRAQALPDLACALIGAQSRSAQPQIDPSEWLRVEPDQRQRSTVRISGPGVDVRNMPERPTKLHLQDARWLESCRLSGSCLVS